MVAVVVAVAALDAGAERGAAAMERAGAATEVVAAAVATERAPGGPLLSDESSGSQLHSKVQRVRWQSQRAWQRALWRLGRRE